MAVRSIEASGDVGLLADPIEVRDDEVENQRRVQAVGDDRQEERHHLHDHLLLWVHRGVLVPAPDLLLLDPGAAEDHEDQEEVGECLNDSRRQGIAGRPREIDTPRHHLGLLAEIHEQL